jgi:sugar lactone lactonase YvrE
MNHHFLSPRLLFAGLAFSVVVTVALAQTAPTITSPPLSKIALVGQPVSFVVSATGGAPLSYQWKHNRQPIAGATGATLNLSSVGLPDRGCYEAIVSNAAGATSSVVWLDVAVSGAVVVAWGQSPSLPSGLSNVVAVSAGSASLALKSDGTVVGWGENGAGQASVPAGLANVVAVSTCGINSLALKSDGTVVEWGYYGSLAPPMGLTNVVAISAGRYFCLALQADGTVVAWGTDNFGQATVPAGLTGVIAIAAGDYHSVALLSNGTVRAWGSNAIGETTVPANLTDVVAIAAGGYVSVALQSAGSVVAWGDFMVAPPTGLRDVVAISSGDSHCLALKADGTVTQFGYISGTAIPVGLRRVLAVEDGANQSLALTAPATGAPLMVTQPTSCVIAAGDTVTFSTTADGAMPLTYQWKKDGATIVGATDATYTIAAAATTDAGNYTITVTNGAGAVTSAVAMLMVSAAAAPTSYTFVTLAGVAHGSRDGTGVAARFWWPNGVAVDSVGNVYVADSGNHTIRKSTPTGVVTTLAGSAGQQGTVDGTGAAARFSYPRYVTVDAAGNVYVADGPRTIRKVTPVGVVTTLAGAAYQTGSTDGLGSAARFTEPHGVAVDGTGNVFVADVATIRKVTPAGVVSTLAGSAGQHGSTDGTGSAARFVSLYGVTVDSVGNLYLTDDADCTIRKVTAAGVVSTLAGSAGQRGSADGTGSAARFSAPDGVTVDTAGNLYVTDTGMHTIRKVTPAGAVSTLAGSTGQPGSADGIGSAARFNAPCGVVVDRAGNVYVADRDNNEIRVLTSGGVVSTLAGVPSSGSADGARAAARFNSPNGVAVDSAGNVYVADSSNSTIRKVTVAGLVTTLAGSSVGQQGNADGVGSAARFDMPRGVAVDSIGNIYVADTFNDIVRKVTPLGVVTTLAGSAGQQGSTDGTSSAARFTLVDAVALDVSGNAYVADRLNHTIRKVTVAGVVSTLAGSAGQSGSADGIGAAARFNSPGGVAVDAVGNVYVSDSENYTIRKVTAAGVVTTLAGNVGQQGIVDGTGSAAQFGSPQGVAADNAGNVYVADFNNYTIRKVTAAGVVTTLAGSTYQSGEADGPGSVARFCGPQGLALDGAGNLYVADSGNNTIRLGVPSSVAVAPSVTLQPSNQTATVGTSATFTLTAVGAPGLSVYQWQRQAAGTMTFLDLANGSAYAGATTATLAVNGVTLATNGDQFRCVVTNVFGSATSTAATLLVVQLPAFTSAATAVFTVGQAGSFTVTATGSPAPTYSVSAGTLPTWASFNPATGVINGTPPGLAGSPFALTLSATNSAGAATQQLTVIVLAMPGITTSPSDQIANQGQDVIFTVVATGSPAPTYQWKKDGTAIAGATNASLTLHNVLLADAGSYTVVVTNSVSSSTSGTALLTVRVPPAITTQPVSQTVTAGATVTFTVVAGGTPPLNYQWYKNGAAIAGATAASYTIATVQAADTARYTVVVSNAVTSATSSAAVLSLNGPPIIVTPPANQVVNTGQSAAFAVVAAGTAPLTYQWSKEGAALGGATAATLTLASAQPADAGRYTVTVSNTLGFVTSPAATLTVLPAGVSATHAVVGDGYVAGGTVTITNTITYAGAAAALGWQVLLPDGWSYASSGGSDGDFKPGIGTSGLLEWAWVTMPASPVTFTYTLNVPANASGNQELAALAIMRLGGNPLQILAKPDPLIVAKAPDRHTADTNGDGKLSLLELTRVIELYNTRNGTSRTGCYAVQAGSEDGFAPEPTRTNSTTVTLTCYHNADTDRNGRLSLFELTRVIELYNYRSGTSRTGQYHAQAGTEDGFAPGPGQN